MVDAPPVSSLLERIYRSPHSPGGLGGVRGLLAAARVINPDIAEERVREFLRGNRAYTLHRIRDKKFPRRKMLSPKPRVIFSCDLADMKLLSRFNNGHTFILVCVDMFSRFLQALPLKRKDAATVKSALETLLENEHSEGVRRLHTDRGKEFYNAPVLRYLTSKNIKLYSTHSDVKAAIAERAIQTLKRRIYRYLTEYNTLSYLPVLQDIVKGLNNTPHRGLGAGGLTPERVHRLHHPRAIIRQFHRMYKTALRPPPRSVDSQLQPGTIVRLVGGKRSSKFARGFYVQNTEEQFRITRVDRSQPIPLYFIEDLSGEKIEGGFYASELIPSTLPDNYPVDIIKSRKKKGGKGKQYLIRFRGYDERFDRWVDESDLSRI